MYSQRNKSCDTVSLVELYHNYHFSLIWMPLKATIWLPKATFCSIIFGLSKSAMHEDLDNNTDRKAETHL